MGLLDPGAGPDNLWSTDLEPSRGQGHAIAVLSAQLLNVPVPVNRLQASVLLTRIQMALANGADLEPLPEITEF